MGLNSNEMIMMERSQPEVAKRIRMEWMRRDKKILSFAGGNSRKCAMSKSCCCRTITRRKDSWHLLGMQSVTEWHAAACIYSLDRFANYFLDEFPALSSGGDPLRRRWNAALSSKEDNVRRNDVKNVPYSKQFDTCSTWILLHACPVNGYN